MKKTLSLFFISFFLTAFAEISAPYGEQYRACAVQKLCEIVHNCPVLVYGTLSNCNENKKTLMVNATLTVKKTLKGGANFTKKIPISYPAYINNTAENKQNKTYRNGATCVFPMYKLNATTWTTEINYCNYDALLSIDDAAQTIVFPNKTIVSLDDFEKGVALYNENYQTFLEAKTNKTKIDLDNPTENKTYAYLVEDFFR
jgi:gamma-glutamylcyclotransferase (GGCT)/AIG2-like uncharacterized protein YtfP